METYKNIKAYFEAVFPVEMKILKDKKDPPTWKAIDEANARFEEKIAEIMAREQTAENSEEAAEPAETAPPEA